MESHPVPDQVLFGARLDVLYTHSFHVMLLFEWTAATSLDRLFHHGYDARPSVSWKLLSHR